MRGDVAVGRGSDHRSKQCQLGRYRDEQEEEYDGEGEEYEYRYLVAIVSTALDFPFLFQNDGTTKIAVQPEFWPWWGS